MRRYALALLLMAACAAALASFWIAQDTYEREAVCETLIEEAASCAEWLMEADLDKIDGSHLQRLWANKLQRECDAPKATVSRLPDSAFPLEGEKTTFFKTDRDGSSLRQLCPCKTLTMDGWTDSKMRDLRVCELFLEDRPHRLHKSTP